MILNKISSVKHIIIGGSDLYVPIVVVGARNVEVVGVGITFTVEEI